MDKKIVEKIENEDEILPEKKKFKLLNKKLIILGSTLVILVGSCLFLLYGPFAYFRNLLITTAMETMNHQYLAEWFYSNETITQVLDETAITEPSDDTNPNLIDTDNTNNEKYADEYEKAILKRDKKNNLYKVIDVSGTTFKGYLVAIYDPSKVELVTSNRLGTIGQYLTDFASSNKAAIAINGGGFIDDGGVGNGGTPQGVILKNGKVIWGSGSVNGLNIIGFSIDNKLILTKLSLNEAVEKYKLEDAINFGPFLIVNGKKANVSNSASLEPRTVIAQRQDGIVLFLVIDGRQIGYSLGATYSDLVDILSKYKAYNAANLDGGSSTALIVNNKLISKPCANSYNKLRALPEAWIVKK